MDFQIREKPAVTVISDYRTVEVLREATFPEDLDVILADPQSQCFEVVIGLTDVSDVCAFTSPQHGLTVANAALRLAGRLPKDSPEWQLGHARSFSIVASRLRGIGELDEADVMYAAAHDFLRGLSGRPEGRIGRLLQKARFPPNRPTCA